MFASSSTRTTMVLCFLAAICEGIDLQAAGVAASGIVPESEPGARQLGFFFSASTAGLFVGALIGGRLSDAIGRKAVLVASIAVFGSFSLLTPLSGDVPTLVAARFATGLGLGGAFPNLIALVSESSGSDRRSANVTLAYAGAPFGGAVASLISLVASAEHWRWVFIVGGVAPLAIAPVMAIALAESPAFEHVKVGATAGMPKAGSFVAIMTEGRALGTLLLWASFFLALLTLYLLLSWLPTLMVGNGLTKPQAATAQIGLNLGGAIAAFLVGRLMEGKFRRPSIVATFVALPILLVLLANAPAGFVMLLGIVVLLGGATVASQAILYALAPACYPTSIRGVGVGSSVAVGRIGSIVGPLFGAFLVGAGRTSSQVLLGLMPIVVVGGICAVALTWWVPALSTPARSSINH